MERWKPLYFFNWRKESLSPYHRKFFWALLVQTWSYLYMKVIVPGRLAVKISCENFFNLLLYVLVVWVNFTPLIQTKFYFLLNIFRFPGIKFIGEFVNENNYMKSCRYMAHYFFLWPPWHFIMWRDWYWL